MTREAVPPRPDPWATTEPREGLRDNNAARIVSLTPVACTMQVGNRSVTYFANMVDFCGHDEDYSPDVFFTGQKAMTLRSKTQHVHGGGQGGKCEPIGHAAQVRVNGAPVIRHGDRFWMDNRRTVGEAQFVRDTACYPAPQDTDPIPGSARTAMVQPGSALGSVTDAGPDGSQAQPDVQLALLDENGQFTRQPPSSLPAAPPAQVPPAPPSNATPPTGPSRPQPKVPGEPQGYGSWPKNPFSGVETYRRLFPGSLERAQIETFNLGPLRDIDLPQADTPNEKAIVQDGIDRIQRDALPTGDVDLAQRIYRETLDKLKEEMRLDGFRLRRQVGKDQKETADKLYPDASGRENVRITGRRPPDPKNECLLIPYGFLDCPKVQGADGEERQQSHHAVADRAFRSTDRPGTLWNSTGYVEGMSQGAGLAICLIGNADTRGTEHYDATRTYNAVTEARAEGGMVRLGDAELAGARGIERATKGRCKVAQLLPQLRAYHQARGMGPDTWVRQQEDPLDADQTKLLGTRAQAPSTR